MTQMTLSAQTDTLYALTSSADALYAARASGLYRSDDGGASWHNLFTALDEPAAATAIAASGPTLLVGTNGAVLRSDDAGASWQVVALASPPPLVTALALSPTFAEDGIVLAATDEDGVFLSDDRGTSWIPWNFSLIDKSVYALALSPHFAHDQTVFAGTQTGLFVSRNGGRGWQDLPFPDDAPPILSLYAAHDGTLVAGTESQGLYASSDAGQTWARQAADAITGSVQAILAHPARPAVLWALAETALFCTSDGQTWQPAATFSASSTAMTLTASGDSWCVGFVDGQVLRIAALKP